MPTTSLPFTGRVPIDGSLLGRLDRALYDETPSGLGSLVLYEMLVSFGRSEAQDYNAA